MSKFNINKVLTHNQCITLNGILQSEIMKQQRKKQSKIKKGELTLYENLRIDEVQTIVDKLQSEQWKQQNW